MMNTLLAGLFIVMGAGGAAVLANVSRNLHYAVSPRLRRYELHATVAACVWLVAWWTAAALISG